MWISYEKKNPDTLEDIHISSEAILKELRSIDVTKARWEIGGELTYPN